MSPQLIRLRSLWFQIHKWLGIVFAILVVPISLLVPHHTRRFGRYMLFGVVATALVVVGVALGVLWFLFNRDG